MPQFNLTEARARFSELVQKAMLGEEVIVTKENKPVVKIVPIKPVKRKPGTGKGHLDVARFRRTAGGLSVIDVNNFGCRRLSCRRWAATTRPVSRLKRRLAGKIACPRFAVWQYRNSEGG